MTFSKSLYVSKTNKIHLKGKQLKKKSAHNISLVSLRICIIKMKMSSIIITY